MQAVLSSDAAPSREASRWPLTLAVLAIAVALAWFVTVRQAVLFAIGIGMGGLLAGARFGFTTGWRRLIENRDASGVFAQIVLLAIAAAISLPLLAAFPGDLMAALGPPSISLLVGAFVFGACMQIADGCGSGTLYKAGLGIPLNMGILPLFALGSFLGSAHLHAWLSLGALPPVALANEWGAGGALLATLAGLAALGLLAWAWSRTKAKHAPTPRLRLAAPQGGAFCLGSGPAAKNNHTPSVGLWDKRLIAAGAGLALLAVANLVVAGQPWGVVYGFGLWAAKVATSVGVFDPAANAFWSQPGNFQALSQTVFLDVTSITNIGIMAGALWIGKKSPTAKPLTGRQWAVGLLAGFLLGYSSRLAFGCNVGAMVSGISTGSLHGWIWVVLAFAGSLIGVRLRRRFGF